MLSGASVQTRPDLQVHFIYILQTFHKTGAQNFNP